MRKIEGFTYNSDLKQFWCKNCKKPTNTIYKDDEGNSFCPLCVENLEKSSESTNENVVEENSTVQKSNIHRKRRQRKLF